MKVGKYERPFLGSECVIDGEGRKWYRSRGLYHDMVNVKDYKDGWYPLGEFAPYQDVLFLLISNKQLRFTLIKRYWDFNGDISAEFLTPTEAKSWYPSAYEELRSAVNGKEQLTFYD